MRLYIDDDVDYGWYVQRKYNAIWVDDASKAYEALTKYEITSIYLDMHIPSVNTADFARQIKKRYPRIKIIINTTLNLTDRQKESVLNFVDGFEQK